LLLGFLTGVALSGVMHGEVRWSDPVVWSSSVLAAWMSLVAGFSFFYRPARQGKKVAYLTLATFVVLVFTLAALLIDPQHGTPRSQRRDRNAEFGMRNAECYEERTKCATRASEYAVLSTQYWMQNAGQASLRYSPHHAYCLLPTACCLLPTLRRCA
jgi:hypothetical protein